MTMTKVFPLPSETSTRASSLAIVVPCFNEQEVLPETTRQLESLMRSFIAEGLIARNSAIYYVDDGSRDDTWAIVERLAERNEFVRGVKLSRNSGHQNALIAGLFAAEGDVLISVDADLQDDLDVIREMLIKYRAGVDIVLGVRKERTTDTFLKRFTAESYYKLLNFMGVEVVFNHADYRLMSRNAVESLRGFQEVNLFLRGIIPLLGYRVDTVMYDRKERFAGESKYPLSKMLALAWQGITSFSALPLRMITWLGLIISLVSLGISLWVLNIRFFTNEAIPGWASTVLPIYFLGGIQFFCIGIIGEYVAKIYMETKRRPRYFIEKLL